MLRWIWMLLVVAVIGRARGATETRVGVIGLDTSHSIAFTEMLNVKKGDPAV